MTAPDAPFDAPWQARLFALTVALRDAGRLDWGDWTRRLGAELATGAAYWDAWDAALSPVLATLGLPEDSLAAAAARWQAAAASTPHGQPVTLRA